MVAVLLVMTALMPTAPRAQTAAVFEVRDIAVDITAETVAAAREQAIADGQARAFRRVLERLTLRADHQHLPAFSPAEIADFVKDFSVADEKTSSVRYLARLNFRFKAEEIRRFLIDTGISFAETPSKPVLVLPVYQAAAALLLWDDPNPWLDAWKKLPPADGLVPFTLPRGDLKDIAAIGAEQAVGGDIQRLAAISIRYGADDTLVAQGILTMGPGGRPQLEAVVTRYGSVLQEQTMVNTFTIQADETMDGLLQRAAAVIVGQVEENWKRNNLLEFDETSVIAVNVPIEDLRRWLNIRQRLSSVAVVRNVELVLLSREEVRINLHYLGEREQLILALKQADLDLTEDGSEWILLPDGSRSSTKR